MFRLFNRFTASLSIVLALTGLAFSPLAGAVTSTQTVTPTNTQNWLFNPDPSTATPYEFSDAKASIGGGSLYVPPIGANPSNKFIAAKNLNIPVTSLSSVSYDYLIAGNGDSNDASQFYLNIYTNLQGSNTYYDCRFDYVPSTGSTASFTPATFNATDTPVNVASANGKSCPTTLAGMTSGSTISFIAINVGDSSNSDEGLGGYLDKVIVNTDDDVTTYDFEPVLAVSTKEACMKGGWQIFNAPSFKNQGDCVSYAARTKTTNTTLNSNDMSGIDVATKKGNMYKVTVSGTWTNRPTEVVDAECTSIGGGSWVNLVSGGYSPDLLDVQVNEDFVDWGPCDSVEHTYTTWVNGDGKPINLRVFDGDVDSNTQTPDWFDDNNGSLNISVVSYPKS